MLSLLGNNPFPINNPLLSVIPPAPACRGRACDFFPPQRRVVPKERALSKEGVRTNNRAIPWQQFYAYNNPLLFVIPPAPACRGSEADLSRRAVEESAVRHSGAPNLSVYNHPSRLCRGIQTAPQELDFIRSSQADTSARLNYAACRGAR